jgi:hypothetical protein
MKKKCGTTEIFGGFLSIDSLHSGCDARRKEVK